MQTILAPPGRTAEGSVTPLADFAVTATPPTGEPRDTFAERLVDAMAAAMEAYAAHLGVEFGRHEALAAFAATAPLLVGAGEPRAIRPAEPQRPGPGRPPAEPAAAELRRVGDLWRVTFAGLSVHLPHRKGIADLATLLARPGQEIAALDLTAETRPGPSGSAAVGTDPLGAPGDLGERLDARARAAYTARIRELQADLDDAAGDAERSARVQHELDFLTRELSAAYGLRGPRRAGDPAERARAAVTWRLRATIAKIRQAHPALGAHLRRSIATGRFCGYHPEEPVTWQITP